MFDDLAKELRDGLVCPVLMGSATRTNGVLRLMKALRHEAPDIATTAKRLGVKAGTDPVAYVIKTLHTAHGGKMSIARVLNGQVADGATFMTPEREAGRVAGVFKLMGQNTEKRGPAQAGETVALGKLDHAMTGDTLTAGKQAHPAFAKVGALSAGARHCGRRQGAQGRRQARPGAAQAAGRRPFGLVVHNPEAHEVVAWGQGEMHLRVATERLADRFGVAIATRKPTVGYRETIKKGDPSSAAATRSSRAATASTATSCVDIKPLPRGSGFMFEEEIKGGVVPRNYIPSVEEGVHRRAQARPARLPGGRRAGEADRRLLSHGRLLRHGVPARRPARHARGPAAVPAGAARADPSGRDRLPVGGDRQDERADVRAGAARSSASTPAKAGTAGTW